MRFRKKNFESDEKISLENKNVEDIRTGKCLAQNSTPHAVVIAVVIAAATYLVLRSQKIEAFVFLVIQALDGFD